MSLSHCIWYQNTANNICYESLNLTVTEIIILQHTLQCGVVSHIFNILATTLTYEAYV